jgi:hypothetical protein
VLAPREALVGMKPEKNASVLLAMMLAIGTQGLSKVDCTTEWFCDDMSDLGYWGLKGLGHTFGWNWNWTRSPAAALTLLGKKASEPLGPPTWMMCVFTIPAAAMAPGAIAPAADELPVDMPILADFVADIRRDSDAATASEDVAAAKPIRAEAMSDVEKSMLSVVFWFVGRVTELSVSSM